MFSIFQKSLGRAAVLLAVLTPLVQASVAFAATVPVVTVLTPSVTEGVRAPLAIALDPRGYYFVADQRMAGISKFDLSGKLLQVLKVKGPVQGVALNDKGNILVSVGTAVAVLDPNGVQLSLLGKGLFKQASGIAVDVRGYVFVADSGANNVKVFTSGGKLVKTIGVKGTANGQFNLPTGIAYERAADQIVVADTRNSRVQFFSATGNYSFVKAIGSFGFEPLQFKSPVGAAFEYDEAGMLTRMYVADLYRNTVQVIDPTDSGTFLSYIAKSGLVNGQLMNPMDVAFDAVNRRLIVVNGNGHLNLFGIDGGVNPGLTQGLVLDPVDATVGTPTITISGSAPVNATIVVTVKSPATSEPVTFTSSNTWKAVVNNLAPGSNVLTATALDSSGSVVSKQAIGIVYSP